MENSMLQLLSRSTIFNVFEDMVQDFVAPSSNGRVQEAT